MNELPYQTYERVTGKKWTGGNSSDVQSAYSQYGITAKAGSAEANLALQSKLNESNTKVDPIKKTTGYASSTSLAGNFNSNSTDLNSKLTVGGTTADKTGAGLTGTDAKSGTVGAGGVKEPKAPKTLDINEFLEEEKDKIEEVYEKKRKDLESLYQTQFANYDQAYANDVMGINQTFAKRIETQKRLDRIDIDRRKAYGIGASGNAQYMPIEYTDAITNRERKSADDIQALDNQRNSLLSQARQAMETGKASVLQGMMNAVNQVEQQMRNAIKSALEEAKMQNDLAWANYEKEKKDFTEEMIKRAKSAVFSLGDEYNNAKTPEEKQAVIQKAILEQGGNPQDVNLLINMDSAFKSNASTVYKDNITKQKDTLAIESAKNTNAKKVADTNKVNNSVNDKNTPNIKVSDAQADMTAKLKTATGADGYIAPEAFTKARQSWVGKGLKDDDIVKNFSSYVNPISKKKLGIK